MASRFALVSALVLVLIPAVASADPRPFTFVTDAYPMGKGDWEIEQWVTYNGDFDADANANGFEFRTEFEFGLADNFDLAFYLPEWTYADDGEGWDTDFEGGAVEGIVYLSNPVTDIVGVALYGEVKVREDELEFEQKVILHKDIDKWTLAYNLVLETEIEGVFDNDEETEVEGVLEHTLGASYRVAPDWGVGAEAVIESVYADWDEYEDTTVWAGPNVTYQGGKIGQGDTEWWATFSPLFQLTDNEEEPNLNFRLIAGLSF
jgi:hypothetical protein